MREVLAHAVPLCEHARDRRGDRRRAGIELELVVNPVHQVDRRREERTPFG